MREEASCRVSSCRRNGQGGVLRYRLRRPHCRAFACDASASIDAALSRGTLEPPSFRAYPLILIPTSVISSPPNHPIPASRISTHAHPTRNVQALRQPVAAAADLAAVVRVLVRRGITAQGKAAAAAARPPPRAVRAHGVGAHAAHAAAPHDALHADVGAERPFRARAKPTIRTLPRRRRRRARRRRPLRGAGVASAGRRRRRRAAAERLR